MTPSLATHDTAQPVSPALIFLLALACGIVVANIYYVQPVVGLISRDYGVSLAASGILVTVTQLGYAAGLLLIVPLGDILENRRLIVAMLGVLVLALGAAFLAPNLVIFLAASLAIGLAASAVQIIVPFAGHLASDATRGRVVGSVVSGLLFGIMLSRPAASFFADLAGDRGIFAVSAAATLLLIPLVLKRRPQGIGYAKALASLWPLLLHTAVLHRRAAYQAAMFGGFSLFWTAAPLLLEGPRFHFSQVGIGLFALVGAGGALVSPFAGRWADAGHTHRVTGLALSAGVLAFLVALLGGYWTSWPLLVVAALILDMGVAANLVVGQRAIFALGPEARGRLNGLYLGLFFIGGAVGSAVAGLALSHGGWTAASLVGLAFPAAALAYYASERPKPFVAPQASDKPVKAPWRSRHLGGNNL